MNDAFRIDGLDELWRETLGDRSVCVAVLDGPVDRSHPAFARSTIECRETLVPCRAGGGLATRHGTQVASILFGRHGGPVAGVAPGCRGLILPIFAEGRGFHALSCSQVDLARAILRAVEGGASVINISGGQAFPAGGAHPLLADALRLCRGRGAVVVSAAGNDGCECLHLPAALPGVLAVGALGRSGQPLDFSNWGKAYRSGGIMAPGEALPGAAPGGGSEACTGTSYASAVVSGVIALLVSLQIKHGQPADPLRVAAALLETAVGCRAVDGPDACRRLLAGRLDLKAAIRSLNRLVPADLGARRQDLRHLGPRFSEGITGTRPTSSPSTVAPSSTTGTIVGAGSRPGFGQPVYPIGQLSFELSARPKPASPPKAGRLAELDNHPWPSSEIVWTLEIDSVPVYALMPAGPHAREVDRRLRQLFREQATGHPGRVAIPGPVAGERTLPSGPTVPLIHPELRGMGPWTTSAFEPDVGAASEFLERGASGHRNLGVTPGDRALNFCWPLAASAVASAAEADMELDDVDVGRCPICPPGRDLWEVTLTFFRPVDGDPATRRTCRFTVDVGDVRPALVAGPRIWSTR